MLQGFDNVTFEFFGSAGSNYSVISSTAFAVNMRLIEAGPLHIRDQEGEGNLFCAERLFQRSETSVTS